MVLSHSLGCAPRAMCSFRASFIMRSQHLAGCAALVTPIAATTETPRAQDLSALPAVPTDAAQTAAVDHSFCCVSFYRLVDLPAPQLVCRCVGACSGVCIAELAIPAGA